MEKGRETERLMPFGQCLRQILKEKRISASALSRMMENKSRNSLFRILEGSTSPATQEAFFHRLVRGNWLSLTKAQQQMLRESLEVSRLGVEGYRSNQAMRKMLRDVDEQRARRPIDLESADRGACGTFDRQLEQYARCRAVSMTLIGCCDREICAAIADGLLHGRGGCRVKITHYLYTGGDEIIRAVAAIQPLLYAPCYEAYCVEPCMFSAEREQTYRANSLIVRWEDHSGQTHLHMFLLVDRNRLLMMDRCGEQAISLMERMWRADRAQMHPLKSAFALRHSPEDYLAYTEAFCELERGRAIYTVKMDMCLAFISTKTLVSPVVDGFTETGFAGQEGLEGLIRAFAQIHQRRFENLFTKKKPTHTIFSVGAMEAFARTGKQSDHFFAMRPYTPQERVDMLRHIQKHTAENPSFKVHFFKDSFDPPKTEISLYEGSGALILRPYTNYDLSGDHAEALITQSAFCEKYKEFFIGDLLARHVLTQEETLSTLERLIALAAAQA